MTFKARWNRAVGRLPSATSTMASSERSSDRSSVSGSGGNFLTRTFSRRSNKMSTSTASTASASTAHTANTIDCPLAGQSKKCNKLPVLEDHGHDGPDDDDDDDGHHHDHDLGLADDTGLRFRNMTASQQHQARLNAYTIKFGASRPWQSSFEGISPCNSRRASLDPSP